MTATPRTMAAAVAALLPAALLAGAIARRADAATATATGTPHGRAAPPKHGHRPKRLLPPAQVKIGRIEFATTPAGGTALLVAVRYPIQARGRRITARVRLRVIGRRALIFPAISHPADAGVLRRPDRRHSFVYVHEFRLPPSSARTFALARARGRHPVVTVGTNGAFDVDHDGTPELSWHAKATRPLPLIPLQPATRELEGERPFCGSIPQIKLAPGEQGRYPLPACDRPVQWQIRSQPAEGSARIVDDELVVRAGPTPGQGEIRLSVGPPLPLTFAAPTEVSVRAIGDSVTAGFGYYSDGSLMSILGLYECKPAGEHLDDACSSNSTSTYDTEKEEPVPYAPDYGLANNVSWAAQWANEYGVTNYKNLAVSGSEPINWAPGGSLYETTAEVEAEDPGYILMTIGANPILSETLFGADPMGCALYADIFGNYSECVEEAFAKVNLRRELRRLYSDLVAKTHSTIYLMQYHLSIPSSALLYSSTQIAEIGALMNRTIAAVAAEVNPKRLQVVAAPPRFNTGLDLEPVVPATYECGYYLTDHVDGPSVQSTVTQYQLHLFHPLEFCPQAEGEEPWVISGDTGIHPSAEGYSHMASSLPAPN